MRRQTQLTCNHVQLGKFSVGNRETSRGRLRDVRVMHQRQRDLTTKNGKVGTLAQSESIGLGIRVLANGAWGFASTDRLTREGVEGCAAQAVAIAKASATAKRHDVVMVDEQATLTVGKVPFAKIHLKFRWKPSWRFCWLPMRRCAASKASR